MKALRSGHIASSCQSKTDVPVPGRWQRDGDGVIDRCYPYVPPLRPRVIRNSDELRCGTGSLRDVEFGRADG